MHLKTKRLIFLLPAIGLIAFSSCVSSGVGLATRSEKLDIQVKESRNLVTAGKFKLQEAPSLDERGQALRGVPVSMITGSLFSLATGAINNMIANSKKKYVSDYQFGMTDMYFYDQLSNESPFDPAGIQFGGFKLLRTFRHRNGDLDTALQAEFEMDTTNVSEIINNSMFRLKVKAFQLRYARAKVNATGEKKINLDIEITVLASYVNEQGSVFDRVVLGKCFLLLRKAPLLSTDVSYKEYYENLRGQLLTGRSFIVPRSFGYHRDAGGATRRGYSQGLYSIEVSVKESTKDNFISRMLIDNAPGIINEAKVNMKTIIK
jgi:hypothetical protein